MKNGILIGIGVFAVSVIGAAVAATAYFKYRQSQIFDEYEEELANDDYYSAKVEPIQEKTAEVEVIVEDIDEDIDEDVEFIDDEIDATDAEDNK